MRVGAARDLGLVGVGEEGGGAALVGGIERLIGEKLEAAAEDDPGAVGGAGKAGIADRARPGGRGEDEGKGQREPQPTTSAG